jgi:hypothetical protein
VAEFSAAIEVFVEHREWLTFLANLSELEKTRRGEAILRAPMARMCRQES